MENNIFLVFLFAISTGILFVGSGITGLYSMDINQMKYCSDRGDCNSGKVCCAFKEGDYITRICAKDCKSIRSLSQSVNNNERTVDGFIFDVTGSDVKEVKGSVDYWVYILIGVILVLLAFFYKKNPETVAVWKKRRKR